MRTWISCNAAYGRGGVGQHLAHVVEAVRAEGRLGRYFATAPRSGDPAGEGVRVPGLRLLFRLPLVRTRPDWRNHLAGDLFDRAVAARLTPEPDRFVGFVGKALHSFRRARRLGVRRLELVALNTHVHHLQRQHRRAAADWPLERSWMGPAQARKTLAEYAAADVIHVHSDHVRETFLAHGVPAAKLRRLVLRPAPRFRPGPVEARGGGLTVVSVGALSVWKGTPVLVEAFRRLDDPAAELVLVGGWSTRGMRRYMEAALAADPRVTVAPGDPLPHLRRADLHVHPSYDDAFGYAPAEALACGVPVVVTDQTGMRELVREGETGWVVPAGDVAALTSRLEALAHA